jgi:hypothetical protein
MKTLCHFAAFVGIAVLPSLAAADALKHVPADAAVVIRINNMETTNAKLVKMAKQMGVEATPWSDPLATMLAAGKLNAGVRKNADLTLIGFAPNRDAGGFEVPLLLLIPIDDYNAFVANFGQGRKDGEVDVVKFPRVPLPGYILKLDEYAAVSASKARLPQGAAPMDLTSACGKVLADAKNDLALYMNTKLVSDAFGPMMKRSQEQMLARFEAMYKQSGGAEQFAPVLRAMAAQWINMSAETMRDANAMALGLSLTDAGLRATQTIDMAPKSRLGQMVAQMKNTDASFTAGLPEADYAVFGGIAHDGQVSAKFFADLMGPVVEEAAKIGESGKSMSAIVDAYKAALGTMDGTTFGIVLDPKDQAGMVKGVTLFDGDSKVFAQSQAQVRQAAGQLGKAMGGPLRNVEVTPKVKTVDGVALDKVSAPLKADPANPRDVMATQLASRMLGGAGLTVWSGAIDAKRTIQIIGPDEKLAEPAVAAAKAKSDAVGKRELLKAPNSQLPANRFAVAYVAVDKVVAAGVQLANMEMGGNLQVNLKPNLPPIGIALSADGSVLRLDAVVPAELVDSLVSAFLQIKLQVMGGGVKPGGL